MSGFDVGMLLGGGGGVQLPDPVSNYTKALTLGGLARQSRMGDMEEEEAVRKLASSKAYEAGLPGLIDKQFSTEAVADFARSNPNAAAQALKEADARRRARIDEAKSVADIRKTESETDKHTLATVGGIAQGIISNPKAGPQDIKSLHGIMRSYGVDPAKFGDASQDPEGWLRNVASSSVEAAKRIELDQTKARDTATERHNINQELNTETANENTRVFQQGTLANSAADRTQRMTIANMVDSRSRDATEATRENTKGTKINAETAAMAKMLDGNMLPNLMTSANALDATIKKYAGKSDMPGVGAYDSRLPSWFQSEEGNAVRSQIQAVANDLLKLYSGGAVTANEAERRATEMMASGSFNEHDLRNAWPLVKGRIDAASSNVRAGFSPEAVDAYERRGGLKLRPIGSEGTKPITGAGGSGPLQQAPKGSGVDFVYNPGGR